MTGGRRRLPGSPLVRLLRHVVDAMTCVAPLPMHSRTGFVLPLRDRTDRRIYERMFVEDMFPCGRHAHLISSQAPTVADVGAFTGGFALSVADWFPQARIHLFEPIPRLGDRVLELAAINGLADRWTLHRAVIGDATGEVDLFCPRSRLGATMLADKAGELGGSRRVLRVPVMRLDDVAAQAGLAGFDIIKIDTEGMEYDAMQSASRSLAVATIVFVRVFPPRTTWQGVDAVLGRHGLTAMTGPDHGTDEHCWIRQPAS